MTVALISFWVLCESKDTGVYLQGVSLDSHKTQHIVTLFKVSSQNSNANPNYYQFLMQPCVTLFITLFINTL
jgi:hypothetical protein